MPISIDVIHPTETRLLIHGPPSIGDLQLWVPEAVTTDIGNASVYPVGEPWQKVGPQWRQRVPQSGTCGPGNAPLVDPDNFECVGIRIPFDGRVEWETVVEMDPASCLGSPDRGVCFEITLRNVGTTLMRKVGAAVCVKFLNRSWWRDEEVMVRTDWRVRSLAELGRDAGRPNGFQAYFVEGESIAHGFYHEFWGINRHRLNEPIMVSRNAQTNQCVCVEARHAYMLHSNPGNPCTDMLLAFGDLAPGQVGRAGGRINFGPGPADTWLIRVAG